MKKGQVTVFIIIGIILLLSLMVILYLQQVRVEEFETAIPIVAEVPQEMLPVRAYIESCVQEIGKDAVKKIGDYGGYISKEKLSFNPVMPTEDEAVQFAPGSDLVIPYWYFLKDKNECRGTCQFSDARPALYTTPGEISIQQQIDEYVTDNLRACIDDFRPFKQEMAFTEKGPLEIEVTLARDDVAFLITWPLEIEKAGQTFSLNEHLASVPVSLQYMYTIATEIANAQAEYRYLEKHTKQLIDIFGRTSKQALPPTSELEIEFGMGEFWIKFEVLEKLQSILHAYVPLLQVGSTRTYTYIKAPEGVRDPALYETIYNRNMFVPGVNNTRPEVGVTFTYLDWWEPYFDLNCDGQLCSAQSMSSTYGFIFGIQRYEFDYDISYPVLVEVTDPTALGGEGYSFKFFLEANMRNNHPMPSLFTALSAVPSVQESLLCLPEHRNSGNITINLRDGRDGSPVDEAALAYICGQESCVLGNSVNGTLQTTLPRCIGGLISASKTHYATAFEPLDIRTNDDHALEMILQPYRIINISIEKFGLRKAIVYDESVSATADFDQSQWYVPATHGVSTDVQTEEVVAGWHLDRVTKEQQEFDENTLIVIARQGKQFDEPHTTVGEVCGAKRAQSAYACGDPPLEQNQVRLVPGTYKINMYAFKYPEPPIIFPPQKKKIPAGLFKKKTIHIPQTPIVFNGTNPWPNGMSEVEWTVGASDLDHAEEIIFRYIYVAIDDVREKDRYLNDLDQIGRTLDLSKQNQALLQPKVKRKT